MTARAVVAGWSGLAPHFLSALRVMVAAVLGVAGTMKVFAFPAGVPPHGGTVPLASQIGVGAVLEVVGGALLLLDAKRGG